MMSKNDKKFLETMHISAGPDECKMCELSEHKAALARDDADKMRENMMALEAREELLVAAKEQWKDEARKWETRCFMALLAAAFLLAALLIPIVQKGVIR